MRLGPPKGKLVEVFFFLWFLLCIFVAVVANGRGRNPALFFFIGLVLSPLIGLIIVLVMSDLIAEKKKATDQAYADQQREMRERDDRERHLESIKAIAATTGQTKPGAAPALVADELMKLVALRDAGVLTPAEFVGQKDALLRNT